VVQINAKAHQKRDAQQEKRQDNISRDFDGPEFGQEIRPTLVTLGADPTAWPDIETQLIT
jgi:hypothetical protein